jgi:Rrf2 family protein
MWLSTKGRYAVRLMLELSCYYRDRHLSVNELSKAQEIPFQYTEQIMVALKRAGLVESFRGPTGGYQLQRPPSEITTGEIVRIMEGTIDPIFCINPKESLKECHRSVTCASRILWMKVGEAIARVMDSVTLEDLVMLQHELKKITTFNKTYGRTNCWEFKRCGRNQGGEKVQELGVCPAYPDYGRFCWRVAGTMCDGVVQGTFAEKLPSCKVCDFFLKVKEEEGERFILDEKERIMQMLKV